MTTLVIVLRVVAVLIFAGPMSLLVTGRRARPRTRSPHRGEDRAPLVANLAAVGLYVPSLLVFSSSPVGSSALLLGALGLLLALVAVTLVLVSRAELGPAWSLVPKVDEGTGLVTTGPYRLVRHPIYLGLTLVAVGEALAFGNRPALMIVLFGILPTFAWRARREEKLLSHTFGERYAVYRQRTRMIIPHLLLAIAWSVPMTGGESAMETARSGVPAAAPRSPVPAWTGRSRELIRPLFDPWVTTGG